MTDAERALLLKMAKLMEEGFHGYANEGVATISLRFSDVQELRTLARAIREEAK